MAILNDSELFPRNYHNNQTFPCPSGKVIAIERVAIESLKDLQTGAMRPRVCVTFIGVDLPYPFQKANYDLLVGGFGRDTDKWIGRNVTVQRIPTRNPNGQTSLGVRFMPVLEAGETEDALV